MTVPISCNDGPATLSGVGLTTLAALLKPGFERMNRALAPEDPTTHSRMVQVERIVTSEVTRVEPVFPQPATLVSWLDTRSRIDRGTVVECTVLQHKPASANIADMSSGIALNQQQVRIFSRSD
jgi:hypothetical protein